MALEDAATTRQLSVDDVLWVLQQIIEPLAQMLPKDSEVVLHDLRRLPQSIVAVEGDVTRRQPGGPATDLLLRAAATNNFETHVGYHTRLDDGRDLNSTTILVRTPEGDPAAALCINTDQSAWRNLQAMIAAVMPIPTELVDGAPTETFVTDVDEFSNNLVTEAVLGTGIPVELMKKAHKKAVVAELDRKGFFLLKESVESVAKALEVTRFTIYNYLNEIAKDAEVETDE